VYRGVLTKGGYVHMWVSSGLATDRGFWPRGVMSANRQRPWLVALFFTSSLKTHLFHKSCPHIGLPFRTLNCTMFSVLVVSLSFNFSTFGRLNWLPVTFWSDVKHFLVDWLIDRVIGRLIDCVCRLCYLQLVSDFCKLDLTCPVPGCGQQEMRILILEGALKLKDRDSKVRIYGLIESFKYDVNVI